MLCLHLFSDPQLPFDFCLTKKGVPIVRGRVKLIYNIYIYIYIIYIIYYIYNIYIYTYIIFTTKGLFEVASESWPE